MHAYSFYSEMVMADGGISFLLFFNKQIMPLLVKKNILGNSTLIPYSWYMTQGKNLFMRQSAHSFFPVYCGLIKTMMIFLSNFSMIGIENGSNM